MAGTDRRTQQTAATRSAILAAARRLFQTRGYAETTVDQIAVEARVAPRTFFRYFPTKDALLFSAFDEAASALPDRLAERPRDEAPLLSALTVVRSLAVELIGDEPNTLWGLSIMESLGVDVGVSASSAIRTRMVAAIAEFIAERHGVEDGRELAWAVMVVGLFAATVRAHRRSETSVDPGERFDALVRVTVRSLNDLCVPG